MIHVYFEPLLEGETGCEGSPAQLAFVGRVERVLGCNCDDENKKIVIVSDRINNKRLVGVFVYDTVPGFNPKEGEEIIGDYLPEVPRSACVRGSQGECLGVAVGQSGNTYVVTTLAGKIIRASTSKKAPVKELSI
jgi:hypothetical protein